MSSTIIVFMKKKPQNQDPRIQNSGPFLIPKVSKFCCFISMLFRPLQTMAVMAQTGMEVKRMLINKEYKNQDLNKDLGRMTRE